jgi:hypothetical protein
MRNLTGIAAGLLVYRRIFLWLGGSDFEEAKAAEFRYCSDVALWRTYQMTDGSSRYGHPDYKGIYDDVCRELEPHDQHGAVNL